MDYSQWFQDFFTKTVEFFPHLVFGIVIFLITVVIANPAASWIAKKIQGKIIDKPTSNVVSTVVRWLILFAGTLLALDQVNFNVTRFFAGLGITGLIIGLALQDITRNFVAGVILLAHKPFNIGDEVEVEGLQGTVLEMNTHGTILRSLDGNAIVLPNSTVYHSHIINFSALKEHRRTIKIRLPYEEDFDKATRLFLDAINQVEGVLDTPPATVLADGMTETAILLNARFWVNHEEYNQLDIHSRVIKAIKEAADKEGIVLPYPIQYVQMGKTS